MTALTVNFRENREYQQERMTWHLNWPSVKLKLRYGKSKVEDVT